ncbi:hypothetical protein [Streptomyces sp. URMC 129]|uniref:hypothetical protein n=1 Tax=Streptomyces sp. URMC 129 TaxID=3423407 RepID=UPI003F1970CE
MAESRPSAGLPERLLRDDEMVRACKDRNFARIFELVKRVGVYPSLIARRCELTPSRVGEVMKGQRTLRDMTVIERVADGLGIPGHMLGLAPRVWESGNVLGAAAPAVARRPEEWGPHTIATQTWSSHPGASPQDSEFTLSLIESQLPQHYRGANYFGARIAIPPVLHQAHSLTQLLEATNSHPRQALLRTGSRVAEFLGWLFQDSGDFRAAAYWSDRSMEWAQEAADDRMQSYILFRKANQATAQLQSDRAVGLARAAQRIPGLTPQITALAVQQEAQAYARMRNPKAALAKFDEAQTLASDHTPSDPQATLDTSYCTPTYIEMQRANCWIELGDARRAVALFEAELASLPKVYRNDRGVYLARLARAYLASTEYEQAAKAATNALAIYSQTGSARTMIELDNFADSAAKLPKSPAIDEFLERFQARQAGFATSPSGNNEGC